MLQLTNPKLDVAIIIQQQLVLLYLLDMCMSKKTDWWQWCPLQIHTETGSHHEYLLPLGLCKPCSNA